MPAVWIKSPCATRAWRSHAQRGGYVRHEAVDWPYRFRREVTYLADSIDAADQVVVPKDGLDHVLVEVMILPEGGWRGRELGLAAAACQFRTRPCPMLIET